MKKAFKYRIYPNKTQQAQMEKSFGCVRFVWNQAVVAFNSPKDNKVEAKKLLPLKKEYGFLYEVSNTILQQKLRDFDSYKNKFFSKRKVLNLGLPRFKKRGVRDSFRLTALDFKLCGNKIQLARIGRVSIMVDRLIPANTRATSVTVSKNKTGQYFASVLTEVEIMPKEKTNKTVGVDLGLKTFLTTSDKETVENPRFYRENQAKLARAQRWFSKKKKGSIRYKKCKLKVAKIHQKTTNQRAHFLHQVTNKLVQGYDQIAIEDLNVTGMVKNRKLAKSISDASFSEFRRQLTYKCLWYGKELVIADRFFPSSKTCSGCGNKKEKLSLSERTYECEHCNLIIDRDYNAALNLRNLVAGVNATQRSSRACKTNTSDNGVAAGFDETSRFNTNHNYKDPKT